MLKKLKELTTAEYEKLKALDTFYHDISNIFRQPTDNDVGKTCNANSHYPCIPFTSPVHKLALALKNIDNGSFLDVGAGYGHIPCIAKAVGFKEVKGIEIQERKNFHFRSQFVDYSCNAMDLNADFYGKYNVIYFFQPMFGNVCEDMYKHVIARSNKGTMFIIIGGVEPFELTCHKLNEDIYVKK